jgi:hypothetical protein
MIPGGPIEAGWTPCESPLLPCAPIGCLVVIYDSQLAEIHKIPPQTGRSFYFLIEKLPKTALQIFSKI